MSAVALVLAAGHSTRFGSDKLSARLDGEPLLHHAIRTARAAPVERVIVVARPGLDTGEWPGTPAVETLRLESYALSETLKVSIAAAGEAKAAFVFLGDMPRIPAEVAPTLAAAIGDAYAAMPCHGASPAIRSCCPPRPCPRSPRSPATRARDACCAAAMTW
ncbi:NTP transferase domain-containing protein [Novosphingobium resinovorum]